MTTPTREQVIADMQALGVPDLWLATLTDRAFEFIAKAAEHYTTAGREQGLRESGTACEVKARCFELTAENTDLDVYHAKASAARSCAAAIEQLRGK